MRGRRLGMAAATALSALSMVVLPAAPASAHYREFRLGNVVGAVGPDHRSVRVCELGTPGHGVMVVQLTDGFTFTLPPVNDRCLRSETSRNVRAFKLGWDQGGGYLSTDWIAP